IMTGEAPRLVVRDPGRLDRDAIAFIGKALDAPAETQRDRWQLLRLGAQHAFDIKLRAAMRQLRRAPRAGQRPDQVACLTRGGKLKPREFLLGDSREICALRRVS